MIRPEGIWRCVGCGRLYPEYINGCVEPHGYPRGVRLVVEDPGDDDREGDGR